MHESIDILPQERVTATNNFVYVCYKRKEREIRHAEININIVTFAIAVDRLGAIFLSAGGNREICK